MLVFLPGREKLLASCFPPFLFPPKRRQSAALFHEQFPKAAFSYSVQLLYGTHTQVIRRFTFPQETDVWFSDP